MRFYEGNWTVHIQISFIISHNLTFFILLYFTGKQASIDFITPDLSVREGRKVRIVCKVSGEPPPKVK